MDFQQSDYYEKSPNDSFANATVIKLNQKYTGNLASSTDIDWYEFYLPSDGNVTITLSRKDKSATSGYWNGYLYADSEKSKTLHSVKLQVAHNEASIDEGLAEGTYYLKVNGAYSDAQYQLKVETDAVDKPPEVENSGPVITHTPVTSVPKGNELTIRLTVTDSTNIVSKVSFFYREVGSVDYKEIVFPALSGKSEVSGTNALPVMSENGIQYYLYAEDDQGVSSTLGTPEKPFTVTQTSEDKTSEDQYQQKDIGNVTVYARSIKPQHESNPNVFIAKDDVTIEKAGSKSDILWFEKELKIDYLNNTVETLEAGELTAQNIKLTPDREPEEISLCQCEFTINTINASDNPPVLTMKKGGSSEFSDNFKFSAPSSITLKNDEVVLKSVAANITQGINVALILGDLVFSQQGNSSQEVKATLGDALKLKGIRLKNSTWTLANLEGTYDLISHNFGATAEFGVPNLFRNGKNGGFGVMFKFVPDPNSPIGFALDAFGGNFNTDINLNRFTRIPPTPPSPIGAIVNKLSFGVYKLSEVANNADWHKLELMGQASMSLTDAANVIPSLEAKLPYKLLSGDLALLIGLSGKVELTGDMKLFEHFPIVNGKISWEHEKRASIEGHLNIFKIVSGTLSVSTSSYQDVVEMGGQLKGKLQLPEETPYIGQVELLEADMSMTLRVSPGEIDLFEIYTYYNLGFTELGMRVDLTDINDPHIYVMGFGEGWNKVRKAGNEDQVTINDEYDFVFIKVNSDKSAALFNITFPDGTVYTPTSTPSPISSDVIDNIFFMRNEAANEAYYALKQPEQGDYTIEITNLTDIGDYDLALRVPNTKPTIALDSLTTDQVWDGVSPIDITWTDSDPDNNAEITLYYDTDNTGYNGALIGIDIMEDDPNNTYQWTLPPDIQSGSYYIYAKIDDRAHVPVFAYSTGKVIINNDNAPATPQNVVVTPGDGNITVNWEENEETNLMSYRVYLSDTPGNDVFEHDFATGLNTSYEIPSLVNGKTYEVAVSAINEDLLNSLRSTPQQVTPNGTRASGSPDLQIDTVASSRDSKTLRVIVKNQGEFQAESATVAYYSESTLIESQTISAIAAKGETEVVFELKEPTTLEPNLLVKINEVTPTELLTSNNVGLIEWQLAKYPKINQVFYFGNKGAVAESQAEFSGGISVNGSAFDLNNNTVKQNTDRITIEGTITPEEAHIGKKADIVVVAHHQFDPDSESCVPTDEADGSGYYIFTGGDKYLDNYCIWDVNTPEVDKPKYGVKLPQHYGDGKSICRLRSATRRVETLRQRWQGNLKTLTPREFAKELQRENPITLYQDTPPYVGHVCLYFGYWLRDSSCQDDDKTCCQQDDKDCTLIFNGDPIQFSVRE